MAAVVVVVDVDVAEGVGLGGVGTWVVIGKLGAEVSIAWQRPL